MEVIPLETELLKYVSFGIRLIEIPIIWPCFYISLFDGSEYFGSLLGFGLQDFMRVSLTVLELRKKWNPGHSYVKYFRTSGGEMHAFNYLH